MIITQVIFYTVLKLVGAAIGRDTAFVVVNGFQNQGFGAAVGAVFYAIDIVLKFCRRKRPQRRESGFEIIGLDNFRF